MDTNKNHFQKELTNIIKNLNIKDKATEDILRELCFISDEKKIKQIMLKHMPELNK